MSRVLLRMRQTLWRAAKSLLPPALRPAVRAWHQRFVFARAMRAFMKDPAACLAPGSMLLRQLVYGWGNDWSAQEDYLEACVAHAVRTSGPVLECGSGLSTVLVGAIALRGGHELWSLEHMGEWGTKVGTYLRKYGLRNVSLCVAPLRAYDGGFSWYAPPLERMPRRFQLVVCDGPPGETEGGRYGLAPVMRDRLGAGCVVLLDDAEREQERGIAKRWEAELPAVAEAQGNVKRFIRLTVLDRGKANSPPARPGSSALTIPDR